jgi:hemerythrin-like domain-containing protein
MLAVLEAVLARLKDHRRVDPEMWNGLLRFFREFVHGCHEVKLETSIRSLLASRVSPSDLGKASFMRSRYESGRTSLEALAGIDIERSDPASRTRLAAIAGQYLDHIRQVVLPERSLLDSLLRRALTAAEDERLAAELNRLERIHIGATGREWYTQLVRDYRNIASTWSHGPTAT